MIVKESISQTEISSFLERVVFGQFGFEQNMNKRERKQNGVFLTNSLSTVENVLNVVEINSELLKKRVLEPSCGQGIFILKLISDVYQLFPDEEVVSKFISSNIYFVDIQKEMVDKTISNIKALYNYLFDETYEGSFNGIVWDFTEKGSKRISLFDEQAFTPFLNLYESFDYVIGNPPYVTLYGRRDKKQNEEQRVNYLKNYSQFPDSVKNGKLNLVMLFIEHSLDFLKKEGKLSFIIDVSFFETAYEFTRKYLLENTRIEELQVNIKDFDVASGQVILKITKTNEQTNNQVKIIDWKAQSTYTVSQASWLNKNDEYKFRYTGCSISKMIIDKINSKGDKTLLQLYPNKNLRTCVMLLDMEDKFTFPELRSQAEMPVYPYYQGSKALSEKYGSLNFAKYFYYNKPLQDAINDELKIQLEKEGIKNKKRLGLGETVIYDNPKIYIRQSAKEIVATIDLKKSSANNSLYVFSLRNNNPETIEFLYFLCGFLNSNLVTYFSQQMNIIRYSHGKQPQIKIGDLGTIFIPTDKNIQKEIYDLSKEIYENGSLKNELLDRINILIYDYYKLTAAEIENINASIKAY
ncbi:MAG: TaqI-like C-terminal specificity domain-containing protein [Flavobacterium sp.]|nr:TaqI-like C-terminal specificity domain-containing protein [Flavobacterium sp.]